MKPAILLAGICLLSPILVSAYPTSLSVIPTADLLEPGSLRIEFENDGYAKPFRGDSEDYYLLQAGLTSRLEVGVDVYDTEEDDLMLNAKCLLLEESDRVPALALGALDIGEGYSPTYYVAAAKSFDRHRLHAGMIGTRHDSEPMLGYEFELGNNAWLMFDWIGGYSGYFTAGIYLEPASLPAINVAFGFPNEDENPDLVLVNLSWTTSFDVPAR